MRTSPPSEFARQRASYRAALALLGVFGTAQILAAGLAISSRLANSDLETDLVTPGLAPVPEEGPAASIHDAGDDSWREFEESLLQSRLSTAAPGQPLSSRTLQHEATGLPGGPTFSNAQTVLDPTVIADPSAADLVAKGVESRTSGDTQLALERLRRALTWAPGHPRVLHELAVTYEAMGLGGKAASCWEQIAEAGDSAGEFLLLAELKLRGVRDPEDALSSALPARPALEIDPVGFFPDPAGSPGQRVVLHVGLRSIPGTEVDPEEVAVHVHFFDSVDGRHIEPTTADPPETRWLTGPTVDWEESGTEVLEVVYSHPPTAPGNEAVLGKREYYGYIIKVFINDTLVDQTASPRTLFGSAFDPDKPSTEPSLFPQSFQ